MIQIMWYMSAHSRKASMLAKESIMIKVSQRDMLAYSHKDMLTLGISMAWNTKYGKKGNLKWRNLKANGQLLNLKGLEYLDKELTMPEMEQKNMKVSFVNKLALVTSQNMARENYTKISS